MLAISTALLCLILSAGYQSFNDESYDLTHIAITKPEHSAGVRSVKIETKRNRVFGLSDAITPGVYSAARAMPTVCFLVELEKPVTETDLTFELRLGEQPSDGVSRPDRLVATPLTGAQLPNGWRGGLRLDTVEKSVSLLPWPGKFINWKGDWSLFKCSLVTTFWLLIALGWSVLAYSTLVCFTKYQASLSDTPEKELNDQRWNWQPLVMLCIFVWALRISLVCTGGQYFFPDESRYAQTQMAVHALLSGNTSDALRRLHSADHLLFRLASLVPAVVEEWTYRSPLIPATFFSLFGPLSVLLVYSITLQLSRCRFSAFVASVCFSGSATMTFFCRHLLPYDMAMAIGLTAIRSALHATGVRSALLTGLFAFLCFITYNGYWTLSSAAILLFALAGDGGVSTRIQRLGQSASGFLGCFALLLAIDWCWIQTFSSTDALATNDAAELPLLVQFRRFSTSVTQGSFAEGWSLPIQYILNADPIFTPSFFVAVCFFLYLIRDQISERAWKADHPRAAWLALLVVALIYICLALFSAGLQKFVVYGRLARQLVPFICIFIGTTLGLACRTRPIRSKTLRILSVAMLGNLMWELTPLFSLTTPQEFRMDARILFEQDSGGLDFQNLEYRHPPTLYTVEKPDNLVLELPHLINFRPFHYEGFMPQDRQFLKDHTVMCRAFRHVPF